MTSAEAKELFSSAYEQELSADQRAQFDAALAADDGLADDYAQFCALLSGGVLGTDAQVPDLLGGVQARLRRRSRGRFYADRFAEQSGRRKGGLEPSLVIAVMVFLVCAAWLALGFFHGPDAGVPRVLP